LWPVSSGGCTAGKFSTHSDSTHNNGGLGQPASFKWRGVAIVREITEQRRKEEEAASRQSSSLTSLGATIYASLFAANAMCGVHRLRSKAVPTIVSLPKPPEPDFGADDAD
jgi:hypothetical protein